MCGQLWPVTRHSLGIDTYQYRTNILLYSVDQNTH